jgi:hypothetical protein
MSFDFRVLTRFLAGAQRTKAKRCFCDAAGKCCLVRFGDLCPASIGAFRLEREALFVFVRSIALIAFGNVRGSFR